MYKEYAQAENGGGISGRPYRGKRKAAGLSGQFRAGRDRPGGVRKGPCGHPPGADATGFIRKTPEAEPEKAKPQGPLRFTSSDGLRILVGRSNAMNDELTGKTARRTDLWLHAQKIHGSHVILLRGRRAAPAHRGGGRGPCRVLFPGAAGGQGQLWITPW
jgi:hypothetical protein